MEVKTICVVGAGTMGTGIAQVAAQAGLRAWLVDTTEAALERSMGDLREIQRLLGAFGDEMRKLDEALRVLSAYVQRMRTKSRVPERSRTVH